MTTLVALPTKNAVVMGCDSLGTVSRLMIDPLRLITEFFDPESGEPLLDEAGKPKLSRDVAVNRAQPVPFDHMTDVDKLFSLKPLGIGAMFTGITSIGDRTVKSLLGEFKKNDGAFTSPVNYTVNSVGNRLLKHLQEYYAEQYGDLPAEFRPHLELILAGYDKSGPYPRVVKIDVEAGTAKLQEPMFWPVFGGQSREIERIVYGIDMEMYIQIEERHQELLNRHVSKLAKANSWDESELPAPGKEQQMFGEGFGPSGVRASWGDFSEQNAIDCVAYFVRIMREAQRFSARMPTVGGAIHVALIDREDGFRFISRREYSHEDHRVQRA